MGDEASSALFATLLMQGFAGMSLFSVLLLSALGLAIIFGQMGVINMAHGEFMTIGAYTTYLLSTFAEEHGFLDVYFIPALFMAFAVAFAAGYLLEIVLIRRLYKRPLDTLLATWGVSLVIQQLFRELFGAREVSPALPEWLTGSYQPVEGIDLPISGMMVLVLMLVVTFGVWLLMYRSRWGIRVRATTQNRVIAGAVGINTKRVDHLTSRSVAVWPASPVPRSPPSPRLARRPARCTSSTPSWWWCSAAPPACSARLPRPSPSRRRSRYWSSS
jgi:urea transport system permease protein